MVVAAAATAGILVYVPSGRTALADDARRDEEQLARVEELSATFRQVAKRVKPAVVQIISTQVASERSARGREGLDLDDLPAPWREFFRGFGGPEGFSRPNPLRQGSGSGVIIDAEKGFILTNNHVVGDAEEKTDVGLRVNLADGRRGIPAKLVGRDPKTDIALIQINADRLEAAVLGDSSKMDVGDWVLAIGAPFGFAQTVTQGIISATGRSVGDTIDYQDWLQTDAAINPGNSGGPLVNMRGEVIGINVAIATSGLVSGYQGVGFAIPIEGIKDFLPDLMAGREPVRGYLGVQIQGLESQPGIEETFGLKPGMSGVLVE
ncbi:MAG: trypsin-like peptidase domain-containing protein, partial [Phycisphaerae bacterium]